MWCPANGAGHRERPSCCENAAWLSNGSRTGQDRRSGLERRLQPAPRPQAANGITLVGFKGLKCGCRFSCWRGAQEDTRMGVSPGGGGARLTQFSRWGRRESGGIPSVFRLIRNTERSGQFSRWGPAGMHRRSNAARFAGHRTCSRCVRPGHPWVARPYPSPALVGCRLAGTLRLRFDFSTSHAGMRRNGPELRL